MARTILMQYSNQEFKAWVIVTDATFQLHWTDYVANEWTEEYEDLAVAVARLAVLIDVVTHDDFFREEPAAFATHARSWLRLRGESIRHRSGDRIDAFGNVVKD